MHQHCPMASLPILSVLHTAPQPNSPSSSPQPTSPRPPALARNLISPIYTSHPLPHIPPLYTPPSFPVWVLPLPIPPSPSQTTSPRSLYRVPPRPTSPRHHSTAPQPPVLPKAHTSMCISSYKALPYTSQRPSTVKPHSLPSQKGLMEGTYRARFPQIPPQAQPPTTGSPCPRPPGSASLHGHNRSPHTPAPHSQSSQ